VHCGDMARTEFGQAVRRWRDRVVPEAAATKYPADQRVKRLIAGLRANSEQFAELWDSGSVDGPEGARKIVDHPEVGAITLDCDVLSVVGPDLRIMVYTAEPGTEDAERLALLAVLGTQNLVP